MSNTETTRQQTINALIERDSAATAVAHAQKGMNVQNLIQWAKPKFSKNEKNELVRTFKPSFIDWFTRYQGNKQLCPCNTLEQASTWKIRQLETQMEESRQEYHFQRDRLTLAEAALKVLHAELPATEQLMSLEELENLERQPLTDDNRYDSPSQAHAGAEVSQANADALVASQLDRAVSQ